MLQDSLQAATPPTLEVQGRHSGHSIGVLLRTMITTPGIRTSMTAIRTTTIRTTTTSVVVSGDGWN